MDIGWAIEGISGSSFKIDLSYLSPYINNGITLEGLNKRYNINLMLSQDITSYMSMYSKNKLRQIDLLTIEGVNQSKFILLIIEIYTIYMNLTSLASEKVKKEDENINESSNTDIMAQNELLKSEIKKLFANIYAWKDFETTNEDFITIHSKYSKEFVAQYIRGFDSYIKGEWKEAQDKFNLCVELFQGKEGVCMNLLKYIKENYNRKTAYTINEFKKDI